MANIPVTFEAINPNDSLTIGFWKTGTTTGYYETIYVSVDGGSTWQSSNIGSMSTGSANTVSFTAPAGGKIMCYGTGTGWGTGNNNRIVFKADKQFKVYGDFISLFVGLNTRIYTETGRIGLRFFYNNTYLTDASDLCLDTDLDNHTGVYYEYKWQNTFLGCTNLTGSLTFNDEGAITSGTWCQGLTSGGTQISSIKVAADISNMSITGQTQIQNSMFTTGSTATLYVPQGSLSNWQAAQSIATGNSGIPSSVTIVGYGSVKTSSPVISGDYYDNFLGPWDLSLACSTEDSTIYYTTDGTTPTTSSTIYYGPIHITDTTTIKAFATSAYDPSSILLVTFNKQAFTSISDLKNSGTGKRYYISGTTTYVSNNYLLLEDSNSGTEFYNSSSLSSLFNVGDIIAVGGNVNNTYSPLAYLFNVLGFDYNKNYYIYSTGNTLPVSYSTLDSINNDPYTYMYRRQQISGVIAAPNNMLYDKSSYYLIDNGLSLPSGVSYGDTCYALTYVYVYNECLGTSLTKMDIPTPTGGGTLVQYQVSGTTVNLDGLVVIQTNKLVISQVTGGTLVAPQTKFFESGDTVVVTAIPDDGYQLDYFSPSGDASHEYSGNTCTLTFGNTDITIAATFVAS